jgi:RHS repeat-associated protein
MTTRRSIQRLGLWEVGTCLIALCLAGGSLVRAQTVSLVCENDCKGLLNLPCFPQVLNVQIVILTNTNTPIGAHGVTVVDTIHNNNVGSFNFTVAKGGAVTPNYGSATYTYGQSPSGKPYQYLSTTIGTYSFSGDNFPLGAWPDNSNWQAPPVIDHRQFNLDQAAGFVATPINSKNLTIQSDYHYTMWAWHSFLGYELPYIPGASAADPVFLPVKFDLRGAPSTIPPTPGVLQCPNQPFPCAGGCGCANSGSPGMATASLDRFQAGIAITDTPISYTPGVGLPMNFTLSYHQRLTSQPASFSYSNLGSQWSGSWLSYIAGGPANGQSSATYNAPDGSTFTFNNYERTVAQGQGAAEINQGDFQANEGWTHSSLHYRQNPERYDRWLPDGTVESYRQPAGTVGNRLFFLSFITDPQGNVTTLSYDPAAAANGQAMLTSVTDPTGSQLVFAYDTTNPLEIVKATRTNDELSAYFHYTNGQLTSITDTMGITSLFQYATGTSFINQMTTPYGNTTFNSVDGPGFLEADMTNPLGQSERVEYQEYLDPSYISASEPTAQVPVISGLMPVDNTNLNHANSFYWNRRAMADAAGPGGAAIDSSGFYAFAQVSHWAESSLGLGSIPVPLSTKKRLEDRVWYNYQGQYPYIAATPTNSDYIDLTTPNVPNSAVLSASTGPSVSARVLDGGATQASFATYNSNGMLTQSIDPINRTTNYSYYASTSTSSASNVDLDQVTQTNSSGGQDVLSTMGNYVQHEPQTMVDAAGQSTYLTYNGQGQLLTSTVAVGGANQETQLAYFPNGYLQTVTAPVAGAVTGYTYDISGRVQAVTDCQNYKLTYSYDNLDRPTQVLYPDGTTDQTVYKNLDVDHTVDRQGRTTQNTYDAIRELLFTTDPLGRTTGYTWCTCGGLSTLTDPNGNVTSWTLDGLGRVTAKTYPDKSAVSYSYILNGGSNLTSRLYSMIDARGTTANYTYNNDDTLAATAYTPGSGVATTPSPNVTFTYDSYYRRVLTMADSTGTTTYSYNPLTPPALGAGRLSSVQSPIYQTGKTALTTYTYDELGRVVTRDVDQANTNLNNTAMTFDALGRVTNVSNALGAFIYAYTAQTGRLLKVTYPTSTAMTTSYSYFPIPTGSGQQDGERLMDSTNSQGSTTLSKFDYTYNPVGTIATWNQQAGASAAIVNTLSYDNADQLINAVQSGGGSAGNAYHYDPAGNRLAEITAGGTATTVGQFNNLNQLIGLTGSATSQTVAGNTSAAASSVTVNSYPASMPSSTNFSAFVPMPSGTNIISVVAQPTATGSSPTTQLYQLTATGPTPAVLTYDANGNVLKDENLNTYQWDALNRLTKITYAVGGSSTFAYDGLSRRVQIVDTTSGGLATTKNYLWIGSEIAEERNPSNGVTKRFFPQGEQQSGTNYYYTRDHLGSVRELLSSTGTVVSRLNYDPYGRTTLVSGTNLSDFQYAGYYEHATSGLNLTMFRAYDPNTARWLSRDPIAEEGGINLYGYVANDPVDYYDPDGLTAAAAGAVLAGGGVLVLGEEGGTLGLGTPVAILTGLGVLGLAGYELLQPGATPSSCEAKQTQPQVIPKGNNGKRAQATAAAAAAPPPPPDPGHNKNARKSTENKHQEGDSRRQADQGGEKGDARRD